MMLDLNGTGMVNYKGVIMDYSNGVIINAHNDGCPKELKLYDNTSEMLIRKQSAILLCGCQLLSCSLVSDVIDTMIVDAMARYSREPWYKRCIKHDFKEARCKLKTNIRTYYDTSIKYRDTAFDMSDDLYDKLRMDLRKMEIGVAMDLHRLHCMNGDATSLSTMICIDSMFCLNQIIYDAIIEKFSKMINTQYERVFRFIRQDDALYWWRRAMDKYVSVFCEDDVYSKKLDNLVTGINIVACTINETVSSMSGMAEFSEKDKERIIQVYNKLHLR